MELLTVIDEQDVIVGNKSRKYVHDKHLIHRGIHVFIINKEREILLQKRSKTKEDRAGYLDASVGGQVLADESYEKAAKREVEEELGIKVKNLDKVAKYKSFSKRQREIRTLFIVYHNGPFHINSREVEWARFFPVVEIKQMIKNKKYKFTDGFKLSFKYYIRKVVDN